MSAAFVYIVDGQISHDHFSTREAALKAAHMAARDSRRPDTAIWTAELTDLTELLRPFTRRLGHQIALAIEAKIPDRHDVYFSSHDRDQLGGFLISWLETNPKYTAGTTNVQQHESTK